MQAWRDGGYLHRDIKPGNIAVDEEGRVRLLDMGHAVRIGKGPKDTREQPKVVGTRGFRAKDAVASLSSEVYSVGATLKHEVRSTLCDGSALPCLAFLATTSAHCHSTCVAHTNRCTPWRAMRIAPTPICGSA